MTSWLERVTRAEALGRCVCGAELDADGCPTCRVRRRDEQDARRDAAVSKGRCRCGRPRKEDRRQCVACLDKDAAYKRTGRLIEARTIEQGLMDE